jgi:hypothetical protein
MKHILKYIFSIWLIFTFSLVQAQEPITVKKVADSTITKAIVPDNSNIDTKPLSDEKQSTVVTEKTNRYGLRVGVDLYKLTRAAYDKNYKGLEFVGDYRLTKKYFLAAEIGNENKTTDDDRVNFTTKGSYLKVGFDYNAYENWLNMENIISIGMRYGVSSFNQELNSYKIYNANPYFGEMPAFAKGLKVNGLTASWIEVVAGIKAKVFNNVFVGFSFRLNRLVSNKQPENFENLYIPGFNRTYNGDFGVGFNYSISYFIPIYKKKVVPIAVPKTNKK